MKITCVGTRQEKNFLVELVPAPYFQLPTLVYDFFGHKKYADFGLLPQTLYKKFKELDEVEVLMKYLNANQIQFIWFENVSRNHFAGLLKKLRDVSLKAELQFLYCDFALVETPELHRFFGKRKIPKISFRNCRNLRCWPADLISFLNLDPNVEICIYAQGLTRDEKIYWKVLADNFLKYIPFAALRTFGICPEGSLVCDRVMNWATSQESFYNQGVLTFQSEVQQLPANRFIIRRKNVAIEIRQLEHARLYPKSAGFYATLYNQLRSPVSFRNDITYMEMKNFMGPTDDHSCQKIKIYDKNYSVFKLVLPHQN